MSKLQSTQDELRYLKRQNLEHEARVMGNYYRDLIRSFGIDCVYHKLDTTEFGNFKTTIDRNTRLKQAYGYDIDPDYSCKCHMLTYADVQQDIFQLNKFGLVPDLDVDFYFDTTDFACALAVKAGQYTEYAIDEKDISCIIPDLSEDDTPYELDLEDNMYTCGILSGEFQALITDHDIGKEYSVICNPYEHTKFNISFPANSDLYQSLKYQIESDDNLETMIRLTYVVNVDDAGRKILTGKISGSVLFFDVNEIGKYAEKLHPNVGDLITIDFPDEKNSEMYEITDCFDKQLTSDGISPLLHKYVWKCKAKRYTANRDDVEENEADQRMQEKLDYDAQVKDEVGASVSFYPGDEDKAYGGMELNDGTLRDYDKQNVANTVAEKYELLDQDSALNIITFGCGSRLATDGYELFFIDATPEENVYVVAQNDHDPVVGKTKFESGLRWLKATDQEIVFVNIEGSSNILVADREATKDQLEICLNNLFDTTVDDQAINEDGDNFVKFKGSRSLIYATDKNLFVKLASNGKLYQLV